MKYKYLLYAGMAAMAAIATNVDAATYLSGTGTAANPVVLNVGSGITADLVIINTGGNSVFIAPGDTSGAFDDLIGGYIQLDDGSSIDVTFSSDFTGGITVFDIDDNSAGTASDNIDILDGNGALLVNLPTVGVNSANSGTEFFDNAQTATFGPEMTISIVNNGNFGGVAVDFATFNQIPEPSVSILGLIGGLGLLMRRKR